MKRKELLDQLNPEKGPQSASSMDPFDELALQGLRLSRTKADVVAAGHRLDGKLDQRYGGTSRWRSLRPFLAIAASVLVLFVCWGAFQLGNEDNHTRIAFQLDPDLPLATIALGVERDVVSSSAERLRAGLIAYEQADFADAATHLTAYAEQQPGQYTIQLFWGHALLEEQPQAAIPVLEACAGNPSLDQNYRDYAQWFLAWAYLRTGEKAKAKSLLVDLAKGASICADDARKLLRQQFSGE